MSEYEVPADEMVIINARSNIRDSYHLDDDCIHIPEFTLEKERKVLADSLDPCPVCVTGTYQATSAGKHPSIAILEAMDPDDWPEDGAGGNRV